MTMSRQRMQPANANHFVNLRGKMLAVSPSRAAATRVSSSKTSTRFSLLHILVYTYKNDLIVMNTFVCKYFAIILTAVYLRIAVRVAVRHFLLTIHIAPFPMGAGDSASRVVNTTHYNCCHYCHMWSHAGMQSSELNCTSLLISVIHWDLH